LWREILADSKPKAARGIVPTLRTKREEWGTHIYDGVIDYKGWATRPTFLQSGVPLSLAIDMPRDAAYLRSGIYDSLSRRVGTLEVPLSGLKEAEVSYESGTADGELRIIMPNLPFWAN